MTFLAWFLVGIIIFILIVGLVGVNKGEGHQEEDEDDEMLFESYLYKEAI